jgi:hypothetical protein
MVLRDQNDNHYWLTRAWFVAPSPGLTGRADEVLVNTAYSQHLKGQIHENR